MMMMRHDFEMYDEMTMLGWPFVYHVVFYTAFLYLF